MALDMLALLLYTIVAELAFFLAIYIEFDDDTPVIFCGLNCVAIIVISSMILWKG